MYNSLMDVWEEYYRLVLNETFRGPGHVNAMIVRYEDVLRDPDRQMHRVCSHLGLKKKASVSIQKRAYKKHGDSNGFASALQKYLHPGYRYSVWPKIALEKMKKTADHNLLYVLGYEFKAEYEYDHMHFDQVDENIFEP